MSDAELASGLDGFLGGRLWLRQPERGHRAGIDAVLLAAAAPVIQNARVLDVGAGCGVVGLCIATRVPDCSVTAIEIDAEMTSLATENAERNHLAGRYRAICGDITLPLAPPARTAVARESFDVVVANPPFHASGSGTQSREPARRRASIMPDGGLEDWVRFMIAMAAPSGVLVMVHQASALGSILGALDNRVGATHVLPLFPRDGQPAHRVLVAARKGSRAPLVLHRGMVLHAAGNAFTPAAEAVLRHGAAITLEP